METSDSGKQKILLVEDEATLSFALEKALIDEGYDIVTAADGEQGLQLALAQHPDLILSDLLLPKMDGITMIRELRKDDWGNGAEIFVLTNIADTAIFEQAIHLGAFRYIIKGDTPISEIVTKVKKHLDAIAAQGAAQ